MASLTLAIPCRPMTCSVFWDNADTFPIGYSRLENSQVYLGLSYFWLRDCQNISDHRNSRCAHNQVHAILAAQLKGVGTRVTTGRKAAEPLWPDFRKLLTRDS